MKSLYCIKVENLRGRGFFLEVVSTHLICKAKSVNVVALCGSIRFILIKFCLFLSFLMSHFPEGKDSILKLVFSFDDLKERPGNSSCLYSDELSVMETSNICGLNANLNERYHFLYIYNHFNRHFN